MSGAGSPPPIAPDRSRPPAPGSESRVPMPEFDLFSTSRGVPVFVAPRSGVPLVELELLLDAGGERNPLQLPGLSAMTASMIDEGTARRTGPELSAELERRGGTLSCYADWNAARISLRLLATDLEYGVALLAELLQKQAAGARRGIRKTGRGCRRAGSRTRPSPATSSTDCAGRRWPSCGAAATSRRRWRTKPSPTIFSPGRTSPIPSPARRKRWRR